MTKEIYELIQEVIHTIEEDFAGIGNDYNELEAIEAIEQELNV